LVFTPDGKRLIAGCFSGTVIGWDPASGKELRTYSRACGRVFALMVSPDGQTLAAGASTAAFVWKTGSGEEVWKSSGLHLNVALLPKGGLLTYDGNGPSRLWDLDMNRV